MENIKLGFQSNNSKQADMNMIKALLRRKALKEGWSYPSEEWLEHKAQEFYKQGADKTYYKKLINERIRT